MPAMRDRDGPLEYPRWYRTRLESVVVLVVVVVERKVGEPC
jgi:hypothetical protein